MQVREIMSTPVKVAKPSDSLQMAARKMAELDAGSLPVCDGEQLIGMVTDRDMAIRGVALGRDPKSATVTEVMTGDVKYCYDDDDVEKVSRTMGELQVRRLPIVNREKKLVGIVSLGDVARASDVQTAGEGLRGVSENSASQRTSSTQRWLVTGLFDDRKGAEGAYQALTERGYGMEDIDLVMSDETRKKYFASEVSGAPVSTELGTKAAKGAGVGGAIGGTLGAIAAAIAAVGTSIAIPGLGLVVAGPLAAALAGAGAGGAAGGLLGALVGAGIPEERVKHYEKGIKGGGILMSVRPRSEEDAKYFEREWKTRGGQHIYR